MYIQGELKDALFAVVENTKLAKFKAQKASTYTNKEEEIHLYSLNQEFFDQISWMNNNHDFVIHLCNNSIYNIYENKPKLEITGSLLQTLYHLRTNQPELANYSNVELIQYSVTTGLIPDMSDKLKRELKAKEDHIKFLKAKEEQQLRNEQRLTKLQTQHKILNQISQQIYQINNTKDLNQPLIAFGNFHTDSIKDCLTTYFSSEFYDMIHEHIQYYVPKTLYNTLYGTNFINDICIAQTTTLNLTGLTTELILKSIPTLIKYIIHNIWKEVHKSTTLSSILQYNQLYLFKYKPTIQLQTSDQGLFLEIKLVPHYWTIKEPPKTYETWSVCNYQTILSIFSNKKAVNIDKIPEPIYDLTIKRNLYEKVHSWKQKHTHLVERIIHKEQTVEKLPFVEPTPNTNLLYVTYIPHSNVIKIGRTQNWMSRKNTYRRNNGPTPETTGDMRLCYCYETPKTGDTVLDKWILYCAEDHLKQLAHNYMTLVAGQEFFKGYPVQNFCILVKNYFQTKSIKDIVAIRNTSDILQYALQNKYDSQRLIETINNL
jgi:hypothetical protein